MVCVGFVGGLVVFVCQNLATAFTFVWCVETFVFWVLFVVAEAIAPSVRPVSEIAVLVVGLVLVLREAGLAEVQSVVG